MNIRMPCPRAALANGTSEPLAWKIPGAARATADGKVNVATCPLLLMARTAPRVGISYGICRLICPVDTNHSGAGTPLMEAEDLLRTYGRGTLPAITVEPARFVPYTPTSCPGAKDSLNDAALLTWSILTVPALPTVSVTGTFTNCGTVFTDCSTSVAV